AASSYLIPFPFFFLFYDPATPEIYTLSLHDALPILFGISPNPDLKPETSRSFELGLKQGFQLGHFKGLFNMAGFYQHYKNTIELDRKSTRLNSSHVKISYAVFCLKKKKQICTNSYYT